jgi:hypothetical protein
MSSKVVLEKRCPDTVISECRVCRRDASEKRGLAGLGQSPWGSVHQDPRINSCGAIAMVSSGHDLPYDSPSSGTTRSLIGCDQPAVRVGKGLHLACELTSCDLYCSAGGRNWPKAEKSPCRNISSGHCGAADAICFQPLTQSGPSGEPAFIDDQHGGR